jgi:hypothetical protein
MTSIISTSAGTYVRSLHGATTEGVGVTYTQDVYRYQLLYDSVISQLNQFINYFSLGDYNKLASTFTKPRYNSLTLKASAQSFNTTAVENLVGFQYDPLKFDLMRESTYNVIDGLNQTLTLVQQNLAYQQDISGLLVYKKTLEDPVLLTEYIEKQKMNTMVFQASETFQTEIKLKPWFEQYLLLYGPPGNGVFRSDLLAQIVIDLIANGTITEDQFINS